MANFLLAWELGANLGHATRLRPVAAGLKARGHGLTFVLRDVVGTQALLGPEFGPTLQAPLSLHGRESMAWSMADILLACGYDSLATLRGLVAAWRAVIELSGCDAMVVDHGPTALLAARLAGVPALHIGHGFSVPPRQSPLPVFRDWAPVPPANADADAKVLACVNRLLAEQGAPQLPGLCDLFYPERTLLCTWPELDHYGAASRSAPAYLGPDSEFQPGVAPQWPELPGPKVFAYLRAEHSEHAAVLSALVAQGCATVCFLPGAQAGAPLPDSPRIHYSAEPIDLLLALQECDLVVCHAGQATVSQAISAGIPCLLMPTQAEQHLLARQVERSGAAVNAASLPRPLNYETVVAEMIRPDGCHRAAAQALAHRYRRFDPAALTAQVVAAAESLVSR